MDGCQKLAMQLQEHAVERILSCEAYKYFISSLRSHTQYLYNICTTSVQRLRRWSIFAQMLYKCFVFVVNGYIVHGQELVTVYTPPPPHTHTLQAWYHFVQGTPDNDISDVTRKKSWDERWVSAIFKHGRHEKLILTIYPVIIDIESKCWCLHQCFQGQRVEGTTYKNWSISMWKIWRNPRLL